MEDSYFNRIVVLAILLVLSVLSFFLLRPVLLSMVFGFILVFIFSPLHDLLRKKVKSKNWSATIVTLGLIIIIVVPIIFLIPVIINEATKLFLFAQDLNFSDLLKNIIPSLQTSNSFSLQIDSVVHSSLSKVTSGLVNYISNLLLNLPTILLQITVVLFTFFFVLRDKSEFMDYIKSVMPFTKEVQERLLKATKDITASVLYGQVVIGIIQGAIAGIGFFLFGAPDPLVFTVFAIVAGILPIVGPPLVWIPMAIYMFLSGSTIGGIGVTIFGIASSTVDNFLRPIIISRRTMMNSLLVLIGMIGGLFLFGILGFILGPLIIAYLLIFLEIYRNKKFTGLIMRQDSVK